VTADSVTAREGTVVTLGARRIAIGNIWQRRYEVGGDERDGITAKLHLDDDTTLVAGAGTVLELDTGRWQVVAVREGEPHGEVVFEPAA
jgi:hypothetical protein